MEQDHIVPSVTQAAQGLQHRLDVAQQIAEDHHQTAVSQHGGNLRQAVSDIRLSGGTQTRKLREHVSQLRAFGARGQAGADLGVEGNQAHGILLVNHQVTQRRRQTDPIVELGQLLLVRESHRATEVHRQIARDVGFRFELLDVILVRLGVHQPIDILGIVAGGVLAMLTELHRESVKRTRMQPLQKAFDDKLGAQVQAGRSAERLRA